MHALNPIEFVEAKTMLGSLRDLAPLRRAGRLLVLGWDSRGREVHAVFWRGVGEDLHLAGRHEEEILEDPLHLSREFIYLGAGGGNGGYSWQAVVGRPSAAHDGRVLLDMTVERLRGSSRAEHWHLRLLAPRNYTEIIVIPTSGRYQTAMLGGSDRTYLYIHGLGMLEVPDVGAVGPRFIRRLVPQWDNGLCSVRLEHVCSEPYWVLAGISTPTIEGEVIFSFQTVIEGLPTWVYSTSTFGREGLHGASAVLDLAPEQQGGILLTRLDPSFGADLGIFAVPSTDGHSFALHAGFLPRRQVRMSA